MEPLHELQKCVKSRTDAELAEMVSLRDSNLVAWPFNTKASVLITAREIKRTGFIEDDDDNFSQYFWHQAARMLLAGDFAELEVVERDRMRMERNTAPAMGASRRQGRL